MAMELPADQSNITDINRTARAFITQRMRWQLALFALLTAGWFGLGFWLLVRKGFDDDIAQIFLVIPVLVGGSLWAYVVQQVRTRFWLQFAHTHGFAYQPKGDPSAEVAVMFRQGHSRRMHHVIVGTAEGRALRISSYRFTIGSGKHSTTYPYTVFEFRFSGQFPHLYLNQRFNGYSVSVGEAVPLPAEFEKKFTLRAPREYEIEALEVFTPDLLAYLLDAEFEHDLEIVDQELLIFTVGFVNTLDDLERKFADAVALAQRLAPKLDRFRFTPIGQLPHTLT